MADRLNSSRLGRAARLGGLAAGTAVRKAGTRTANVARSEEAREAANRKAALETAERMVTVLGSMRGAAVKIGQSLSVVDIGFTDEEVREEFQAKLAKLQNMAPTVAFADMRKVVEEDLGQPLDAVFAEFDETAIAAASIGQVHRARLRDGREVAVKIQYPGIKDIVRADLKNVHLLLKAAARVTPGLATKEVAREVVERITEELDYELEAANHRAMARAYRDHPFIVVPDVITELSRERVLVTEFVHGRPFAAVTGDAAAARARFGEILFRFYVSGPFRNRLLNGDPHPGNSLFLDDGRVAFLDFGFFKRQSKEQVEVQRTVLQAAYAQDAQRLYELSRAQGIVTAGPEIADKLLEKYRVATWWFLDDREVSVQPSDVTRIVLEHANMRSDGFGEITLPAEQVTTMRAFGLVLGVLSQLGATANWSLIARETLFGDEPQTELGRLEAEWVAGGRVPATPA
ncbi:hypothetical protein DSM112329_04633 [Paraconexibacter sp. AEG42_29]|uniref:ABC1 atypical kinase-like domain-containing protein n=1 Tax=Paraconexibacter sp. AEG42_29 TaxID=2997339 RepID=A0AAU7B1J0_9ACTN